MYLHNKSINDLKKSLAFLSAGITANLAFLQNKKEQVTEMEFIYLETLMHQEVAAVNQIATILKLQDDAELYRFAEHALKNLPVVKNKIVKLKEDTKVNVTKS